MDSLHRETRRILLESRNQLEALEAASTNTQLDPAASSVVTASFRDNVMLLGANLSSLRGLIAREPPSRREVWRARLRDLDAQIGELRGGDARCAMRFRKIAAERAVRDELFQRRGAGTGGGGGDAVLRMGGLEEGRSLEVSEGIAEGILNGGRETLMKLVGQGGKLRRGKKKMVEIMKGLGVDRRIIASIERRQTSDGILVYGMMIVLLVLLALAVLWKNKGK